MYVQLSDPVDHHFKKLEDILQKFHDQEILIFADCNAKSSLWHSRETDGKREVLKDLNLQRDLQIQNQPGNPPTFRGRAGAITNIDITLDTGGIASGIENWRVLDSVTISDYNVILFIYKQRSHGSVASRYQQEENDQAYNPDSINWRK